MEGPLGLEPRTRGLKGRCSNQLSYGPRIYIRDKLNSTLFLCYCQCEDFLPWCGVRVMRISPSAAKIPSTISRLLLCCTVL